MLASSHSKKGASRMRPYLMISEMPDASSRSGRLSSVAMSISTAAKCRARGLLRSQRQ